jgi:hypothetical protein
MHQSDKMDAKNIQKLFDSYMEKGETFEVSKRLQIQQDMLTISQVA